MPFRFISSLSTYFVVKSVSGNCLKVSLSMFLNFFLIFALFQLHVSYSHVSYDNDDVCFCILIEDKVQIPSSLKFEESNNE